jgi:hypothetical protein
MEGAPQAIASTWGDALTAYINGDPDATPASFGGVMGSGDIGVGCQNNGQQQWNGTVRNVKIYNKELSEDQVGDL